MRQSLLGLVVVLALSGCSFSADYAAAQASCRDFHRQVDQGEYGSIYDAGLPAFQAGATKEQIVGMFSRVSRILGKCGEASVNFGGIQATTNGTFVTTTGARNCQNGVLGEKFVWQMKSGQALLVQYTATNPLLLTD
jgi:hypothetical protein